VNRRLLGIAAVVVAARGLSGQASVPQRQLVEELRLDASREDFPLIHWLTVGPHGEIAVPIDQDQQIRLYDVAGRRIKVVGRVGGGPGEFRAISHTGWRGDSLWAYDDALKRVTMMPLVGKAQRTIPLAPSMNEGGATPNTVAPDKIFSFVPMTLRADGRMIGTAMLGTSRAGDTRTVVLSSSPDGTSRRTLAEVPADDPAFVTLRPTGSSAVMHAVPFTTASMVRFSPDGSRFAILSVEPGESDATYRLTIISADGDTILHRVEQIAGERIPADTIERRLNAIGRPGRSGIAPYSPAVAAEMRKLVRARIPRVYPPVENVALGLDGSVWLVLRGSKTVVFDEKGTPLMRVQLPPRTSLIQATRDRIWTIQADDDGLTSVVRYRLLK
jgi:hypothetical protein